MRSSTSEYRLRLMVLPKRHESKALNGEIPGTWPASGTKYYAKVDSLNAGEQMAQAVNQSTGTMKVRIKGRKIPVRIEDRVRLVVTGELFRVTGVSRDGDTDETLLTLDRVSQQTCDQ